MRSTFQEPVRAIVCKACGKLLKVSAMPMDAAGRPAINFRMTCLKCHHGDIYNVHDVLQLNARKSG
ncbi:MAG TPA: hypothetical protein PLH23_10920 [Hyphomonadaceae bacterium]|jgi:RNase P subunit RPR2|nr:hypothetical protein [Hyphomonadaceae bacterium]HPI48772.1 hypothetical protein [Hyphomonadaceae bacterium]